MNNDGIVGGLWNGIVNAVKTSPFGTWAVSSLGILGFSKGLGFFSGIGALVKSVGAAVGIGAKLGVLISSPYVIVPLIVGIAVAGIYYSYKNKDTSTTINGINQTEMQDNLAETQENISSQLKPDQDYLDTVDKINNGTYFGNPTTPQGNSGNNGNGGSTATNVGQINPEDYKTSNPYIGGNSEIPSIDYVSQAIDTALANQDKAQQNFQDTLASIMPNTNDLNNMLQSNLDSIQNPFDVTEETGEEETNNEEVTKLIEEMKEKLDFDEEDFEAIEAYEIEVGGVKSYLSVTSDIKVITDLEDYKEFGLDKFTGTKYTENGQTHYVARAYDVDGKPLDAVIESIQEGYLAFGGRSGSNGFAKLSGSGNESNYCIEGYGAITFGGVEKYSFYIQGNYDNKEHLTIEISEKTGSAVSDVYKGTLRTAMETMRAVNNGSYDIQKAEDGIVFEFDMDTKGSTKKETINENGHEYTYNKNDKVTITNENIDMKDIDGVKTDGLLNSSTNTTLTIEEALNMGYKMEDLIEQGYKPLEKDGKEFTEDTQLEDEVKEAKFEITLKKDPEFKDMSVQFYVEGTKIYYTNGNYADIVRVTDEEGNIYTAKSAIENKICTVEVLLKKLEKEFNVTYGIMGQN